MAYFHRVLGLLLLLSAISGCVRGRRAEGPAAPPQTARPAAADFVICIDNSRSISPPEQIMIREIAMLVGDLAEPGDRVTVVTFGEGARIAAAAQIGSDADRLALKREIRRTVRFDERLSDIRAAVKLISAEQARLFRTSGAVRAPILLSDGKLEPQGGDVAGAFQQMKDELSGPLAQTPIYAVALGEEAARTSVLAGMSARDLMEQHVARSADRFYAATKLDQLLDIAVAILSKSKGISSLGEPGKTRFKIDSSVDSMTLIVRKKSVAGTPLCRSADIRLARSEPQPAIALTAGDAPAHGLANSIYWTSDYEYFDLVAVQKPAPGIWEITLANGARPEVVAKIATSLDLRVTSRGSYYLNESAAIAASLFDRRAGETSRLPVRIQAHIAAGGDLDRSPAFVPLRSDAATGQHVLEAPAELLTALGRAGQPGVIQMELVAEQPGNPWFIRRSQRMAVRVEKPFLRWIPAPPAVTRIPFVTRELAIGAEMEAGAGSGPDFEMPPEVAVGIERQDGGQWRADRQVTLRAGGGARPLYDWRAELPPSGRYRYRYRVTGTTRSAGSLAVESPWFTLDVRFPWAPAAAAALLLLALLSHATTRLRGVVEASRGRQIGDAVFVNQRRFDSARIDLLDHDTYRFHISGLRVLYLYRRTTLTLTRGEADVDGAVLRAPARRTLGRGEHVVTCGGTRIELSLRV